MYQFDKKFDFVIDRAKSLKKPVRAVIAGAELETTMEGALEAEAQGICTPILVGNGPKIRALLEKMNRQPGDYEIVHVEDKYTQNEYHNYVTKAISIINEGRGDILMRGNTSARDYLMPILDKKYGMVEGLVSEVSLVKVPYYDKVLALSDVSVLINPTEGQRKKVIKNMVSVLNYLGIQRPSVAVLALVEKPSFHMRDTVEAQNIVRAHNFEPIADCDLVGPIPWDLIVSKRAAERKEYDCPFCGEFDAVLMPNVMAGNTIVKVLSKSANVNCCGILAGTRVPVANTSRGSFAEEVYLSICVAAAMVKQ